MLKARLGEEAVEASRAERGPRYDCPKCRNEVILKAGRIKIAHFAHKPPTDCTWAKGETIAHLLAKSVLAEAMRKRGIRAEVEFVIEALPNDRRTDVAVWLRDNVVAVEFQHTPISLDEIEARSLADLRPANSSRFG